MVMGSYFYNYINRGNSYFSCPQNEDNLLKKGLTLFVSIP